MGNYIAELFWDMILSIVTKKYGSSLNDAQKQEKADEIIDQLIAENKFTYNMTQALCEKKDFNNFYSTTVKGKPVYALEKVGMFKKVKTCYFITRIKNDITSEYLELIYEELRKQAMGENVFESPDYK